MSDVPENPQIRWMTLEETCAYFGDISPATLYRGIRSGAYARPVKVGPNISRWLEHENAAARAKLIAARDRVAA